MWYIIVAIWVTGKMAAVYSLPSHSFVGQSECIQYGLTLQKNWQGKDEATTWGFQCARYFEA